MTEQPKVSWFIVSYAKDADWIPYLLKSLGRNSIGFHEIVIAIPEEDLEVFKRFGLTKEKLVTFKNGRNSGFMAHQRIKCNADKYCDGDYICHIDSDCQLAKPTTPDYYVIDGKPVLWHRSYACLTNKETGKCEVPWRVPTEKFMRQPVENEFMCRHGCTYHRYTYPYFNDFCKKMHGVDLEGYLEGRHQWSPPEMQFSEFNALGAYCYQFEREVYHWVDVGPTCNEVNASDKGHPIVQHWSHHRARHPQVQRKLKEMGLA